MHFQVVVSLSTKMRRTGAECLVEFGDGVTVIGECRVANDEIHLSVPACRTTKGTLVAARRWRVRMAYGGQTVRLVPGDGHVADTARATVQNTPSSRHAQEHARVVGIASSKRKPYRQLPCYCDDSGVSCAIGFGRTIRPSAHNVGRTLRQSPKIVCPLCHAFQRAQ